MTPGDHITRGQVDPSGIANMSSPVRCAYCGGVYDTGKVSVVARYADCSVWKTPCCGVTVDDRGETDRKSKRDYYPLGRDGSELRRGES